jgi:hypothetical protein
VKTPIPTACRNSQNPFRTSVLFDFTAGEPEVLTASICEESKKKGHPTKLRDNLADWSISAEFITA